MGEVTSISLHYAILKNKDTTKKEKSCFLDGRNALLPSLILHMSFIQTIGHIK